MTRPSDLDLWQQQLAEAIARNSQGHPAAAQRAFAKLLRAILASGDTRPEVLLMGSRAHLGMATSTFDQHGDVGAALRVRANLLHAEGQVNVAEAWRRSGGRGGARCRCLSRRCFSCRW